MMELSTKTKVMNGTDKLNGYVMCNTDFFGDPMPGTKK